MDPNQAKDARKRVKHDRRAYKRSLTSNVTKIAGRDFTMHHDRKPYTGTSRAELVEIFSDPAYRFRGLPSDMVNHYLLNGYLDPCGFHSGRFSTFSSFVGFWNYIPWGPKDVAIWQPSPTADDSLAMVALQTNSVKLCWASPDKVCSETLKPFSKRILVKATDECGDQIDIAETLADCTTFAEFEPDRTLNAHMHAKDARFFRAGKEGEEHTFSVILAAPGGCSVVLRFFSRSNPNIRSIYFEEYTTLIPYRNGFIYYRGKEIARYVAADCPPTDLLDFKMRTNAGPLVLLGDSIYTGINADKVYEKSAHHAYAIKGAVTDAYCLTRLPCSPPGNTLVGIAPAGCPDGDATLFSEIFESDHVQVLCADYSGFVIGYPITYPNDGKITRVRFEQKRRHDSDHEHDALQINDCSWGADLPSEDCAPKDLVCYEYPEGVDPAEGLGWDTFHQ
jgi:hypothetical protein